MNERRERESEGERERGRERARGERDLQKWSERAASVRVCKKTLGPESVIKCALCANVLFACLVHRVFACLVHRVHAASAGPSESPNIPNPLLSPPLSCFAPGAPGFPVSFDKSLQKAGLQPGTNPRQAFQNPVLLQAPKKESSKHILLRTQKSGTVLALSCSVLRHQVITQEHGCRLLCIFACGDSRVLQTNVTSVALDQYSQLYLSFAHLR